MKPIKLLLQTTISHTEDDWHIGRFRLLREHLESLTDGSGNPLVEVTARNRDTMDKDDPILSQLAESDFNVLWLFAVDTGNGLSPNDAAGINAFRNQGGGLLLTRDHQDLGSCLCLLADVGQAHYFHSSNADPDQERCCIDDTFTASISWPNYHSGQNGNYHEIIVLDQTHQLLQSEEGLLRYFPAHPHEGGIGVPPGNNNAKVIATGKSRTSGRDFNLVVAFEPYDGKGPTIVQSSFHHFCDYNWDIDSGCPSFVGEAPGQGYKQDPDALSDIKTYVKNAALWLSGYNIQQTEASKATVGLL